MKLGGFSLIECIVAFSIAAICCACAVPGIHSFIHSHHAHATMQQLQQSIVLARSIAIARNCSVAIYPQDDSLLLKIEDSGFIKRIPLNMAADTRLSLLQSGFSNQSLTIQANGMAYTNGHFNYKSKKPNSLPQFNLYFNRALRTYVLVDR